MLSVFHKIIRVILIVAPVVVLGWLTVKEIVPSGKVTAVYDMRRETPFVSKLYPKDRVSEAQRTPDGNFYRSFLVEPVYFDLKPGKQFEKVTVVVKYKNSGQAPLKMGPLVNKKEWAFDWRDLPAGDGGWLRAKEVFDFSKITPEGNNLRFGFSAPGLGQNEVEIGGIEVVFERKPLTEKEVVNKILDAFIWRMNKIFQ